MFWKTKILIKLLNIEKKEVYKKIEKTKNHYLKTINLDGINARLKIKFLIVKYFPFIYKLKIILKRENI